MLDELDKTLRIDDETFLVFDMFNGQMEMRNKSAWRKYKSLVSFYINPSTSKFNKTTVGFWWL